MTLTITVFNLLLLLNSHCNLNVFNSNKTTKFGQNITNFECHGKSLIFFYFCELDFIGYC